MNLASRNTGQNKTFHGGSHFSTRGWVTPSIVGFFCLLLVTAAFERGHGNLHKIRTKVDPPPPQEPIALGPGGQDPIRLTRSATTIGKEAELLSATLLPGRGMNVFQITAMIPGHGEVPLLMSPPIGEAADILNGKGGDAYGASSTTLGGAILLPWAQQLTGAESNTPGILQADWNGRRLSFPALDHGTRSVEGLLLNRAADSVKSEVLSDGQSAQAVYNPGDFGGSWPSTMQVTVTAALTAHDLDLTVTAKNTGQQAMPMGIGWQPHFAIPSGDRANALISIPSQAVVEVDHRTGLPTGKIVPVDDSARDFSHARGSKLGTAALNETYTSLQTGASAGPVAEISDPAYNLKVSIIPMSASITSMHVIAPAEKSWVSVGPDTNLDDPFGPEWGNPENAGMVTLAPGATMTWKVRIEISLLATSSPTEQ